MAFQQERWSENASGMTGHGALAIYDGAGQVAQDGDLVSAITANNFFDSDVVKDAIARASQGKTDGGLLCLMRGRGDVVLDVLELYEATVSGQRVTRVRSKGTATAAFRVTG